MLTSSRLDRAFRYIEKHWKVFSAIGVTVLALAYLFQRELIEFFRPHRPFFETLALIFGVPVTAGGFYMGYRSKREMVDIQRESIDQLKQYAAAQAAESAKAAALAERLSQREGELARTGLQVSAQRSEILAKSQRVDLLEANLRRVAESGHELWNADPAKPFLQYEAWRDAAEGAKIVTVGNLKGGVGKTTIAANLAAYASERVPHKPVLVIDLDYQGSLSNMMMYAAGMGEVPSHAERLLAPDASLTTLLDAKISLNPKLPNAWLVPASYTLANAESGYLLKWLMEPASVPDARFRLARVLLDPVVRREFSLIILDMPPRMTLAGVNALFASHAFVVPALLDRMSVEAVQQFLTMVQGIKTEAKLSIELLGLVGSLTIEDAVHSREEPSWQALSDAGRRTWADREFRFERTIPRKVAISSSAGGDIAYVADERPDRAQARRFFTPLFDEMWGRLHPVVIARLEHPTSPQDPDS